MTSALRYSAPLLFVRARCLPRIAIAVPLVVLAQLTLADSTYVVLFSDFELRAAIAPLLPAAWGFLVGFALLRQQPELELRSRRLAWSRLGWAATLTLLCLALTLPLAIASTQSTLMLLRNTLLMTGMAMFAAVILGALRAWLPAVFTTAVCFFAGHFYEGEDPHWWALPLQPDDSITAASAAVAISTVGVLTYAVWDSRHSPGLPAA